MTEYQVLQKVEEAIKALDEYNRSYFAKGSLENQIKSKLPILLEKSHALYAAGQTCNCCNGSGRKAL